MSPVSLPARRLLVFPLLVILALLLPLTAGCGKKTKATVSGTVLYKGSPMPGGILVLHPEASGDKAPLPPSIPIGVNGDFSSADIPAGKYKVTVQPAAPSRSFEDPREAMKDRRDKPRNVEMPDLPQMSKAPQLPSTGTKPVELDPKYMSPTDTPLSWEITAGKNPAKEFRVD